MPADNDGAITGTADKMGPWTIKVFPNEVRNMVAAAARDEGVTVPQWLERVIRERVAGKPVGNPSYQPNQSGSSPDRLIDLLREARAMAQAPEVPASLTKAVVALTREAVRQARGLPPLAPRQRRLAGPDTIRPVTLPADQENA
jgi:hypothetical protein